LLVVCAGCQSPAVYFLPEPIPLTLDGDALVSTATINHASPFPVVIDTASPVTVYDDQQNHTALSSGTFTLLDASGRPRLQLDDLRLYTTPLRSLGVSGFPIGGVLGGDSLQRWVIGFDYRTPSITIQDALTSCGCELAQQCDATFMFTLAGGGTDRQLTIGGDVLSYPPSRILVDVCLDPLADPLSRDQPCAGMTDGDITNPAYLSSGVDARLIVSTGFPGFALSTSMYERLHGLGSAPAPSLHVHLPDTADDGDGAAGLPVGQATIGASGIASVVLVERLGYLGPCAELARSRRQRRNPLDARRVSESGCLLTDACYGSSSSSDYCNDTSGTAKSRVSANVEIDDPLPTYVMADSAPILAGINADVRPNSATVDGIIGTEVLKRLVGFIDYPNHRLVARCAGSGCLTYPLAIDWNSIDTHCAHDQLCVRPVDIPPPTAGLCPSL
jgi:hypothetical protein